MVAENAADGRQVRPTRNGKRALVQIDKRLASSRRIADLIAIYGQRAGLDPDDPDPLLQSAVDSAARMQALAESTSARALRGDPNVSLDDVVRLSRWADLLVRRLRINERTVPSTPSLSSYLQRGEP
jgi:hypothetical protein